MNHLIATPSLKYLHPDQGDAPRADPTVDAKMWLAKTTHEILQHHYPNQLFRIEVFHTDNPRDGAVVGICLPPMMMPPYFYKIPTRKMRTFNDFQTHVMRAGGTILEMYNIPRARFSLTHHVAAIEAIPAWRKPYGFIPV